MSDEPPQREHYELGKFVQFLRRNYFLIQLHDRQVVAAMPEKLLAVGAEFKEGWDVHVKVRLRKSPRMARIIEAHRAVWCG